MYLHPKKSWQVVKLIKSSKLPENCHGNESADHFTSSFQERLPWVRKVNRNKFRFQNTYQLEIHTAHKCIKCNFRWFIKHEKKNQACAFILMNGLTFLFTVWFNNNKKKKKWLKSDWNSRSQTHERECWQTRNSPGLLFSLRDFFVT